MEFLVGYRDSEDFGVTWRQVVEPAIQSRATLLADGVLSAPGDQDAINAFWRESGDDVQFLACYAGTLLERSEHRIVFVPRELSWTRSRPTTIEAPVTEAPPPETAYFLRSEAGLEEAFARMAAAEEIGALASSGEIRDPSAIQAALDHLQGQGGDTLIVCYEGRAVGEGFIPLRLGWSATIEDLTTSAAPLPEVAVAAEAPPRRHLNPVRLAAVAVACAALIFGLVRAASLIGHQGSSKAQKRTASSSSPGSKRTLASATGPSPLSAALKKKAEAKSQDAQKAAASVSQAAATSQHLVASSTKTAAHVSTLSNLTSARNPKATSPKSALSTLKKAVSTADALLASAQKAVGTANADFQAVQAITTGYPGAATVTQAAATASDGAKTALSTVTSADHDLVTLLSSATAKVTAWEKVHSAPHGTLGVKAVSTPAGWTVKGCEILSATAGGPARTAGLVGADQRTDPVGDVITSLKDVTAGKTFAVPTCTALGDAMAWTRAGDSLVIHYDHRHVIWYLLSGTWIPRTATLTLGGGASANACPAPLTGQISAVGNRINLTIRLKGPKGKTPFPAILDTGAGTTSFSDSALRAAGFTPVGSTSVYGVVPGATTPAYVYQIPGSDLQVLDGKSYVPLAQGNITVTGIPQSSMELLGPDILRDGATLSTAGSRWVLTPPCP